jgi:hypothetical protein
MFGEAGRRAIPAAICYDTILRLGAHPGNWLAFHIVTHIPDFRFCHAAGIGGRG